MSPFRSLPEYGEFVYTLRQSHPQIVRSTLFISPHGNPVLAETDPHHKHIPPDVKHHREPAPRLCFDQPNLPFLIEEIWQLEIG